MRRPCQAWRSSGCALCLRRRTAMPPPRAARPSCSWTSWTPCALRELGGRAGRKGTGRRLEGENFALTPRVAGTGAFGGERWPPSGGALSTLAPPAKPHRSIGRPRLHTDGVHGCGEGRAGGPTAPSKSKTRLFPRFFFRIARSPRLLRLACSLPTRPPSRPMASAGEHYKRRGTSLIGAYLETRRRGAQTRMERREE